MTSNSTIVEVFVLPTGYLWLPDEWIVADGDPRIKHLCPNFSFLIRHPSGKNALFDLGLRKDLHNLPRVAKKGFDIIEPYVPKDASDLLSEASIKPDDINYVILSHLHFDHTGDVSQYPEAEVLLGPGSTSVAAPGYPAAEESSFDGAIFAHALVREFEKSQYQPLPPGTVPRDFPFDKGIDFFGDSSLYILDAPGHMQGHQRALARTGAQEWVAMGGDCCHHRDFLEGLSREIGVSAGPGGQPGFHKDPEDARTTIPKTQI
ncbi:unnamed protein product [Clonostachys rosea]|uniref:Metallo-beta-lactamase domain-containing protein n=1 Tax=Bionectria ochroleuca TaxID=29856 RepID=A0ABY6ULE8_BIOOC|nr:unnamed protein product [Clonostachys rosea]